jgi:hypothetical protein
MEGKGVVREERPLYTRCVYGRIPFPWKGKVWYGRRDLYMCVREKPLPIIEMRVREKTLPIREMCTGDDPSYKRDVYGRLPLLQEVHVKEITFSTSRDASWM